MLSLEQIRRLEQKVHQAVERIATLESEKRALKEQLTEARAQATKLEARIEQQTKDQAAIEHGILAALEQLDQLEHEISDASHNSQPGSTGDSSDDSFAGIEKNGIGNSSSNDGGAPTAEGSAPPEAMHRPATQPAAGVQQSESPQIPPQHSADDHMESTADADSDENLGADKPDQNQELDIF